MKKLISKIDELRSSEIKNRVDRRILEFEEVGKNKDLIFSELCFCILTANSSADNCIRVQKEAGEHFDSLEGDRLAGKLKEVGCRFHTKRAGYIVEARKNRNELIEKVGELESRELRQWIADTIKGIGMKEASHFLRNIGHKNLAIIDFHIIDILDKEGIIKKPKKLDRENYLKIEKELERLGERMNLSLAELDLYLWYLETGKILK